MKHSSIFFTLLMIVMLAAAPAFAAEEMTVVASPTLGGDTIAVGTTIRFTVTWTNDTTGPIGGFSNGFQVYEKNGGDFHQITWDFLDVGWANYMDGAIFADSNTAFSITGTGRDTIGFGGFALLTTGIPAGFNRAVWYIESGSDVSGDTLCIDSSYYPPGGPFIWSVRPADTTAYTFTPNWGGPYCFHVQGPTDVDVDGALILPDDFALNQNYPNPFNPTTTIAFDIPVRTHVTLTIFNILGQKVTTLIDRELAAKHYDDVVWDGTTDGGSPAASGIYFYKIQAGDFVETKKMMLLK